MEICAPATGASGWAPDCHCLPCRRLGYGTGAVRGRQSGRVDDSASARDSMTSTRRRSQHVRSPQTARVSADRRRAGGKSILGSPTADRRAIFRSCACKHDRRGRTNISILFNLLTCSTPLHDIRARNGPSILGLRLRNQDKCLPQPGAPKPARRHREHVRRSPWNDHSHLSSADGMAHLLNRRPVICTRGGVAWIRFLMTPSSACSNPAPP